MAPDAQPPAPPEPDLTLAFASVPVLAMADVFADLGAALHGGLGQPLSAEQSAGDACDAQQLTTTGVAYWSCASGTSTFDAADGRHRWTFGDGYLAEWVGDDLEAPLPGLPMAVAESLNLVCIGANDNEQDGCIMSAGDTTATTIDSAGSNKVYRFEVGAATDRVHVDLTHLPADYDLYLVDASSSVLAESVQEDTLPESIDALLTPGTYSVYVHSDPGRDVDPYNPFVLHLDMAP